MIFDAALSWLERGAALLPLQPGGKRIVPGFGPYLQTITTEAAARFWFRERRCNMGLVCGCGFVVFDFDDAERYAAWAAGNPALAETYTEQTRRGFHVFFTGSGRVRHGPGYEAKSVGGVVTLSPSVVHGFEYLVVNSSAIMALQSAFFLLSEPSAGRSVVKRDAVGGDALSRVKAAWSVVDLAQSVTRLKSDGRGRWFHGRCPLVDHASNHDGRLPFWVDSKRGLWGCYACGIRGDVVNLYAALHSVTVDQAIKAMAAEL